MKLHPVLAALQQELISPELLPLPSAGILSISGYRWWVIITTTRRAGSSVSQCVSLVSFIGRKSSYPKWVFFSRQEILFTGNKSFGLQYTVCKTNLILSFYVLQSSATAPHYHMHVITAKFFVKINFFPIQNWVYI